MCFVLFAWFARARLLAGIVTTATGKGCNECKHLFNRDWSAFKCSDTKVVFQTAIFLILVVRNNKRSSGIEGKPAITFPEIVYITVILSNISAGDCSMNRLNL